MSEPVTILVDADACPVKDEIYRVALRHGLPVSVVGDDYVVFDSIGPDEKYYRLYK